MAMQSIAITASSDITVNPVNDAPRDLVIPSANFPENSQGLRLGKLKVTDPDENDSHVFLLSDKRFEVINDELRLAAGAHFDLKLNPR